MASLATGNHIIQGEYRVTADPDVALTTLLGSCVAACIWDPLLHVGGMNHFLLPGDNEQQIRDSERFGVHLMELLVNALFRHGASRQRLVAKLFGGANMNSQLADIGSRNAEFAQRFLRNEDIKIVGESLGGDRARKLQFWPATGRARQMLLPKDVAPSEPRKTLVPDLAGSGAVELF
ncbi:MAG: chemotaxis protein CheD [Beijerinckiaceae bacterium]|jgi:chemotaxis protein CheD|nr:chemotaxis protein CheD [Beijerinckiaceae bacterium]MDO9443122.1 chemotaxis protein CheD [Beijerinckiaceae bacterium]